MNGASQASWALKAKPTQSRMKAPRAPRVHTRSDEETQIPSRATRIPDASVRPQ